MQTPQDPHKHKFAHKQIKTCEHCDRYLYTIEDHDCNDEYEMCPRCLYKALQGKQIVQNLTN
jgi:hypothetical protein